MITWTREDYLAVLKEHREGSSRKEIGTRLGVSRERVRQILITAERLEAARHLDPLHELPVRVRNCLKSHGIRTLDQIRAEFFGRIVTLDGMGAVGIDHVRRWLETQV